MTVSSQGFSGVVIALVMRVVRGKGAGGLGLQRSRAGRHKVAHAHPCRYSQGFPKVRTLFKGQNSTPLSF